MQIPWEVSYRNVRPTTTIQSLIDEKVAGLERFYPRIIGCHVTIERPGRHHRHGKGAHFRVRIELTVPGGRLVVGRDPEEAKDHENAYLAIQEAFRAMRRQLQEYASRQRGDVKFHPFPFPAPAPA